MQSIQKDMRSRTQKKSDVAVDARPRTTLSFYQYVQIADPVGFKNKLSLAWSPLGCLGRIYVADEGINAQISIPVEHWEQFDTWVQTQPELQGVSYKFAVTEGTVPSFFKLMIKVKDKIVADGLDDESFIVTNTGDYLTAREMNEYVHDSEAVVVDMRNNYETEVGHFAGALRPDVVTFRDELQKMPELLRVHKNKKIALYCTGGIRCEKASAWLKHNGFSDVRHLEGGIIDYAHQVREQNIENMFLGKNFVFDERLSEQVGSEVIATCHLCKKTKADTHYHCQNQICNNLFIGCDACVERKKGYCAFACQSVDFLPPAYKKRLAKYFNFYVRKRRPFVKTRIRV